eukprot:2066394-Amphidinium_carterae.2
MEPCKVSRAHAALTNRMVVNAGMGGIARLVDFATLVVVQFALNARLHPLLQARPVDRGGSSTKTVLVSRKASRLPTLSLRDQEVLVITMARKERARLKEELEAGKTKL